MTTKTEENKQTDSSYFPLVGVSPLATVGCDINVFFHNGTWLGKLRHYIARNRLLPSSLRMCDLPQEAMVVKAHSRYLTEGPVSMPRYHTLAFTSKTAEHNRFGGGWGYQWTPRLLCYLCFQSKKEWERGTEVHYGEFLARNHQTRNNRLMPSPRFQESDPEWTLFPTLTFSQCPGLSLDDLTSIQVGVESLLKLYQLSFQIQYDASTEEWIQGSNL